MPSIVDRLRSALTPQSDVERFEGWPEAQQAIADAQILDPRAEGVGFYPQSPVSGMAGKLRSKLLGVGEIAGEASAKVPGVNRVVLDKGAMERNNAAGDNLTVRSLLAHELEHSKQRKDAGFLQHLVNMVREGGYAYGTGPLEAPAFTAEYGQKQRKDIALPAQGPKDPTLTQRMLARGK